MGKKLVAKEVDIDSYFSKLRENVVLAELALMQLVVVTKHLVGRDEIAADLRVNLEVQEQALKDMLVLGIARLFDRKGKKGDQLSIPNILESKAINLTADHRRDIQRLISSPAVHHTRTIRDSMVAHSLSHASDATLQTSDLLPIIDGCYKIIASIYQHNRPSKALKRENISAYSVKWREMTKDWR